MSDDDDGIKRLMGSLITIGGIFLTAYIVDKFSSKNNKTTELTNSNEENSSYDYSAGKNNDDDSDEYICEYCKDIVPENDKEKYKLGNTILCFHCADS